MKQQTEYIKVLLTPEYKEKIRNDAKEMDISLSNYFKIAADFFRNLRKTNLKFEPSENTLKAYYDSFKQRGVRTGQRKASEVLQEIL